MPPQGQFFNGSGAQGADFPGYGQPDNEALARRQPGPVFPSRQPGSPSRQTQARLVAPGGRHRRPMPASLPESAPALVLAVPDACDNGLAGATAEIATVLRVDNPALDVRTARIDHGGRGDPAGIRAVLDDAAARRPAGRPLGRGGAAGCDAAPGGCPGGAGGHHGQRGQRAHR